MNRKRKSTQNLPIYFLVLLICVACNRPAGTESADNTAQTNEDAEIAARLTVVAEDQAINPIAEPTSITSTKQLGVDIIRVGANTPTPPPTATFTPIPPTPTFTVVPPTFTSPPPTSPPPTNTPILLPTEPPPPTSQPTSPPTSSPTSSPTSPSAQAAVQSIGNFNGTWSTNVGDIELTQAGDQVSGTYQLYGDTVRHTMSGSIAGRVLTGTYTGFDGGTFRFELDPDGRSFDGSWFYQGEGPDYHWCGVRSGPLKPWCGFSGPWESIGDYVPDTPPITEVVQTGDRIRGTFLNGVYNEIGQLDGQVGRQGVGSQFVAIGRWSIAGFSGDFRWELLGNRSDQTVGYSVTSDGVLHQWCNWRPGLSMPAQCFEPE